MRALAAAVVAVAACGGAADHARAPRDEPVPPVRLAAARGRTLRLMHATADGVVVERTVALPAPAAELVWAGPQLAVRLRDDTAGRVTADGFAAFPAVEWPHQDAPTADSDTQRYDPPQWQLFARGSEIWQGRCAWGSLDTGACTEWTYARRFPEPVAFSTDFLSDRGGYILSAATAPPRDLRCDLGAGTWLSATPPVFVAYTGVVFEGCEPSARFHDVAVGPHGVVALDGAQLALAFRGHLLGAPVDGADVLAFAP
jgi:hypothetical protein|nr:hypothetical protein [Kofleriaceae bacterium]